jgi:hypothetical protein
VRSFLGHEPGDGSGGGREGRALGLPGLERDRDVEVDRLFPVRADTDHVLLRTAEGQDSEGEHCGQVHGALEGVGESGHPVTEPGGERPDRERLAPGGTIHGCPALRGFIETLRIREWVQREGAFEITIVVVFHFDPPSSSALLRKT